MSNNNVVLLKGTSQSTAFSEARVGSKCFCRLDLNDKKLQCTQISYLIFVKKTETNDSQYRRRQKMRRTFGRSWNTRGKRGMV